MPESVPGGSISTPLTPGSPWEDTPANRRAVEVLLGNLTVENGLRLAVANLDYDTGGLLKELETAQSQVQALLQIIPAESSQTGRDSPRMFAARRKASIPGVMSNPACDTRHIAVEVPSPP